MQFISSDEGTTDGSKLCSSSDSHLPLPTCDTRPKKKRRRRRWVLRLSSPEILSSGNESVSTTCPSLYNAPLSINVKQKAVISYELTEARKFDQIKSGKDYWPSRESPTPMSKISRMSHRVASPSHRRVARTAAGRLSGQSYRRVAGQSHERVTGPLRRKVTGPLHRNHAGQLHENQAGPSHENQAGPSHINQAGPSHENQAGPSQGSKAGPVRGRVTEPLRRRVTRQSHRNQARPCSPSRSSSSSSSKSSARNKVRRKFRNRNNSSKSSSSSESRSRSRTWKELLNGHAYESQTNSEQKLNMTRCSRSHSRIVKKGQRKLRSTPDTPFTALSEECMEMLKRLESEDEVSSEESLNLVSLCPKSKPHYWNPDLSSSSAVSPEISPRKKYRELNAKTLNRYSGRYPKRISNRRKNIKPKIRTPKNTDLRSAYLPRNQAQVKPKRRRGKKQNCSRKNIRKRITTRKVSSRLSSKPFHAPNHPDGSASTRRKQPPESTRHQDESHDYLIESIVKLISEIIANTVVNLVSGVEKIVGVNLLAHLAADIVVDAVEELSQDIMADLIADNGLRMKTAVADIVMYMKINLREDLIKRIGGNHS